MATKTKKRKYTKKQPTLAQRIKTLFQTFLDNSSELSRNRPAILLAIATVVAVVLAVIL